MSLKHVLCDRYFHSLLFILTEILCGRLDYPHSKDGKMGLTEIVQVVTLEPNWSLTTGSAELVWNLHLPNPTALVCFSTSH